MIKYDLTWSCFVFKRLHSSAYSTDVVVLNVGATECAIKSFLPVSQCRNNTLLNYTTHTHIHTTLRMMKAKDQIWYFVIRVVVVVEGIIDIITKSC